VHLEPRRLDGSRVDSVTGEAMERLGRRIVGEDDRPIRSGDGADRTGDPGELVGTVRVVTLRGDRRYPLGPWSYAGRTDDRTPLNLMVNALTPRRTTARS